MMAKGQAEKDRNWGMGFLAGIKSLTSCKPMRKRQELQAQDLKQLVWTCMGQELPNIQA